jgi:glutathionyl-hydroquinone reductase
MSQSVPSCEAPSQADPADPADPAAGVRRAADGTVVRPPARFRGRVTADGSSGFPAEPHRYRLHVSWGCSWSNRAAIVRKLLGLGDVIAISYADDDPAALRDAWESAQPGIGRYRVPVLWDTRTGVIVSSDADGISRDLAAEFAAYARPWVDLYPARLRNEIDRTNEWMFHHIHSTVHLLGHEADPGRHRVLVADTHQALAALDQRLAARRYLHGDQLTESDVRLFVSLVRLEAAFPGLFETSAARPGGYRHLWRYARQLYAVPAFGSTINRPVITANFADAFRYLRPGTVVPGGCPSDWTTAPAGAPAPLPATGTHPPAVSHGRATSSHVAASPGSGSAAGARSPDRTMARYRPSKAGCAFVRPWYTCSRAKVRHRSAVLTSGRRLPSA